MCRVLLLLLITLALQAEFLRVDVNFEGVGCASCINSLEGRLGRVRGVERVEVDAERSQVNIHLAENNRVRLGPLVSRITQDGTKITQTAVVAKGTITTDAEQTQFQPSGLTKPYRLELVEGVSIENPPEGAIFRVEGTVTGFEPGSEPVLRAKSVAVTRQ